MPDYHLNERVLCARHALAIDDERDAFHPLLWDEVHEDTLIQSKKVAENRLQQVWFTGMHADVGGGYPDESLSYVSLLWMMEEAERADLRTLTVIKDRFVALASSFGPIHDSRAGVGAYYRYQPRKIAAWLDPVDARTLSLRDPAITDDRGKSRGLLRSVKVHESVINRIATGTDRYAPITLPKTFRIVPPQAARGERSPGRQSDARPGSSGGLSKPMIDPAFARDWRITLAADARAGAMESIWNLVWWRRIIYFVTLAATLLLLSLPLMVGRLPRPPILTDGRTWIGGVIRLLTIVASLVRRPVGRSLCRQSVLFPSPGRSDRRAARVRDADRTNASRRRPAGVAACVGGYGPGAAHVLAADVQEQPALSALRSTIQVVLPAGLGRGAADSCPVRLDCLRGVHTGGVAVSGKWHRVVPAVARGGPGD